MNCRPYQTLLCALACVHLAGVANGDEPPAAAPVGATLSAGAPAPATAETEQPAAWTIEFHPGVWYVGFGGDIKLPRTASGGNSSTDLNELNLTSPRLSPFGEATVRKDRWLIGVRGFAFGTDRDGIATETSTLGNIDVSPGDAMRSSLDVAALEIEGGYTVYRSDIERMESGGFKLRTKLDVLVGARLINFDFETTRLDALGGSSISDTQSADEFTGHPLLGGRFTADFYDRFTIIAEITGGGQPIGDSTSYGFDIIVGGQWRPIRNVGIHIGYRAIFLGIESGNGADEFSFTGTGQGLCAGVTFTF